MNTHNKEQKRIRKYTGIGGGAGMIFGGLVGLLIGNPIVFAGGGTVLGIAIGTAFEQRTNE